MCDRIVELRNGELVKVKTADSTPDEITAMITGAWPGLPSTGEIGRTQIRCVTCTAVGGAWLSSRARRSPGYTVVVAAAPVAERSRPPRAASGIVMHGEQVH